MVVATNLHRRSTLDPAMKTFHHRFLKNHGDGLSWKTNSIVLYINKEQIYMNLGQNLKKTVHGVKTFCKDYWVAKRASKCLARPKANSLPCL